MIAGYCRVSKTQGAEAALSRVSTQVTSSHAISMQADRAFQGAYGLNFQGCIYLLYLLSERCIRRDPFAESFTWN